MNKIAISFVPSPRHVLAGHPESPERFAGLPALLDRFTGADLVRLAPAPDVSQAVARVHDGAYLERLRVACAGGPMLIDPAPTYVTPASFDSALAAAGGALAVVEAVCAGGSEAGLALIRPPGHHAPAGQAMGFCLLNNVAIAARAAQHLGLRRIMIVDFDVHHGNGTQAITESDPDILFVSTHQHGIYPGTGHWSEAGSGAGAGSVVNVPLPAGAGDGAFGLIAARVLGPLAHRHRPDLILVSAGFDAHWRDPLAGLQLSITGYHSLTLSLISLARDHGAGRIVFLTEGGYDPEVVSDAASAVLAGLTGREPDDDLLGPAPSPEPDISALLERISERHGI